MVAPAEDPYFRREQTQVKHYILRHYLQRFAHIVGHHWTSITYVDGFAGPWNVRSHDLKDSSFAIALDELRTARATHEARGRALGLRCFFLEESRSAYLQLKSFADGIKDAEVKVRNGSFESSVQSIKDFVREDRGTFSFIFIDPTGWTGFARKLISPLLQLDPGEVLINFMTGHIRRFLNDENSRHSFKELFGSDEVFDRLAGLSGQDLDDALVDEYGRALKDEGRFNYVLPAIVLHPEIDRTHFHLIYATRHAKGVEVFKEAEQAAMREMERLRAEAQQRKREERKRQRELFASAEAGPSPYYNQLRDRYLVAAKQQTLVMLKRQRRLSYDGAWVAVLSSPLVWESDLKDWIKEWQAAGVVRLEGLEARERVPKRERSHVLLWQGPED
jgi:three-Cys-motif partner protein